MKRNRSRLKHVLLLMVYILSVSGILTGICTGGMALYRWMMTASEFAIAEIKVYDNELVRSDEIIALSGLNPGDNIFRVNLHEAMVGLKRDPRLLRVFLRRALPNRIHVYVVERNPVAIIQLDRLYGVDADASLIPLPTTDRLPNLPVITGFQPEGSVRVSRGRPMDARGDGVTAAILQSPMMHRAIYVIGQLQTLSPELLDRISEVHVRDPDDPILYTMRDGMAIRLGVGRYPTKLKRLRTMFERLKRDSISTSSIDLRFKNQVIVRPIVTGTPQNTQS